MSMLLCFNCREDIQIVMRLASKGEGCSHAAGARGEALSAQSAGPSSMCSSRRCLSACPHGQFLREGNKAAFCQKHGGQENWSVMIESHIYAAYKLGQEVHRSF